MRTPRPLALGALLAAAILTACAAPSEPEAERTPTPKATASAPPTPAATTEPAGEEDPEPSGEPTCETIITAGTVEGLTSQGWTSKQEELRIGDQLFDEGLLCLWSDFSAPSDHGQMYGWAPLDAEAANSAQSTLQAEGWLRSSEGGSVFFTEDPDVAIATDENGFGMTYEFGDGWVKLADTKQGLLLIEWEQAG